MKRWLFLLLLIPALCFAGPFSNYFRSIDTGGCTIAYTKDSGGDTNLNHALYNDQQLHGIIWDDGSSGSICQVDLYVQTTSGTPANNDYYVEVYLLSGNNLDDRSQSAGNEPVGRSDKVDGSAWSGEFVSFTFSTPAAYDCTGANQYAIVLKQLDDGDTATDYGEYDLTNYITLRFDNENAGDSTQNGVGYWDVQDSGSFDGTNGALDAEDDLLIKVYTQ
jgi:hypothetical protein